MTDKNDKRIFGGDILKWEYEFFVSARKTEKATKIGYVESNSIALGCYAYYWDSEANRRYNFNVSHSCEVIGNIHDNPELLGGDSE